MFVGKTRISVRGPRSLGERLVKETRNALDSLLPFTESEKEFLDRLLGYGEVELLLLTRLAQL